MSSEVEPKTKFMGHEISSFHAPVVSSFIVLFKNLVSSWSIRYVHLVKLKLITLYCPKISPDFVKSASRTVPISIRTVRKLSRTVPISTCTYPQFNLISWKNHHVMSHNFTWFCRIIILYCPNFELYCPKIVLYCPNFNLYLPSIQFNLLKTSSCTVPQMHLILSNHYLVLSQFRIVLSENRHVMSQ